MYQLLRSRLRKEGFGGLGLRIRVDDVTLNVVDEGQGEPVLLLHGFPDSSRLWRHQIAALTTAGFRAIAPDLRGFGESDRPEGVASYSMPRILGDLVSLLDRLGVQVTHLVGHDWGAIAAWAFAGRLPQRVGRLVAISVGHPAGFARLSLSQLRKSWYVILFQLPRLAEAALRLNDWRLFRSLFGTSPDFETYVEDLSRRGALTAGLNWYRANGRPDRTLTRAKRDFPRVHVSTMGIFGSKDWALTEEQMKRSERYLDAPWRYERMEAGHWIPLRHAEQLNVLLVDFLS